MTKLLFATETVKTSQGWFESAALMPQQDLPAEEIEQLIADKKAGTCEHDSPLATVVHQLAAQPNKAAASVVLKGAMGSISAESPGDEPIEIKADEADEAMKAKAEEANAKAAEEKPAGGASESPTT